MSTYFNDIAGALRSHLTLLDSVPPIAWENERFDSDGELYLGAFFLPAPTNQISMGDGGRDEVSGVFQVNVYQPANRGSSPWPDRIADHFKRGTILTQLGTSTRVRNVGLSPAFRDGSYYIMPVNITFLATFGERIP